MYFRLTLFLSFSVFWLSFHTISDFRHSAQEVSEINILTVFPKVNITFCLFNDAEFAFGGTGSWVSTIFLKSIKY